MIDNLTMVKNCRLPNAFLKSGNENLEYRSIIFYPRSLNGQIYRYEGVIKNLRLYWYPNKLYACNSIHKYWKGNNFSDFHLFEMKAALEMLSDETGIEWIDSALKKLEYGCNLEANASKIHQNLKSYKNKDYLPMHHKGKVYGAACEFTDYKIKGYDKTFQLKIQSNISLDYSLFRWEVAVHRMRVVETKVQKSPLTGKDLMLPEIWQKLAEDAVEKYLKTLKMQWIDLYKLTSHEKRVLAEMLIPEIKEDMKRHNRETYKRDRRIFRRILGDKGACIKDNLAEQLGAKFSQLIY